MRSKQSEKAPSSSTSLNSTHMNVSESVNNPFDAYHNYIQIYGTSFHLHQQSVSINQRRASIITRIHQIQQLLQKHVLAAEDQDQDIPKPKRRRRQANQINKQFICNQQKCQRSYGTLGSLQQHQRLKHPQMFRFSDNTKSFQYLGLHQQKDKLRDRSGQIFGTLIDKKQLL